MTIQYQIIQIDETGLHPLCSVVRACRRVLTVAAELLSKQRNIRTRAVLTMIGDRWGQHMLRHDFRLVDQVLITKDVEKSFFVSREKVNRLREMIPEGHTTSYESRDPNAFLPGQNTKEKALGKWGGAILCHDQDGGKCILSLSGLPELWDEAVVLVTAIRLGWLLERDVLTHFSPNRNPHLREILEVFFQQDDC